LKHYSGTASFRDPIHGFIHADPLEQALINSRPLQRLRWIRQLAFAYLVFPGAEHSRFSHALGAMELAGKAYDALAVRPDSPLDPDPLSPDRRRLRVAALVHDIGHAPFSHSAEDLFTGGIDHEEMTRRLLALDEIGEIFAAYGEGLEPASLEPLLTGAGNDADALLAKVISGELDVDKMDYLLRDSLYCGVRYGTYDLDRMLETILPLRDPDSGSWGMGIDEGGVHALEALVMARYYMFTQVYFNLTGKALELHFSEWLREAGRHWPDDPESFLRQDDVSVMTEMREDDNRHARAVVERDYFPLAYETDEHLTREEKAEFEGLLPGVLEEFGSDRLLVSNSAKDPHRLGQSRVLVRRSGGTLTPMEEVSQFMRHLSRIDRYRIYTAPELRNQVAAHLQQLWG
jgi:HD superfamily phosphohydrolase